MHRFYCLINFRSFAKAFSFGRFSVVLPLLIAVACEIIPPISRALSWFEKPATTSSYFVSHTIKTMICMVLISDLGQYLPYLYTMYLDDQSCIQYYFIMDYTCLHKRGSQGLINMDYYYNIAGTLMLKSIISQAFFSSSLPILLSLLQLTFQYIKKTLLRRKVELHRPEFQFATQYSKVVVIVFTCAFFAIVNPLVCTVASIFFISKLIFDKWLLATFYKSEHSMDGALHIQILAFASSLSLIACFMMIFSVSPRSTIYRIILGALMLLVAVVQLAVAILMRCNKQRMAKSLRKTYPHRHVQDFAHAYEQPFKQHILHLLPSVAA